MKDDIFSMIITDGKQQLQTLMDCNQYTEKFGVKLSKEEALQILQSRKERLKELERLELNEGILPKLIFTFCDSPYIYQDNYADSIESLLEIFYLYKNESLEELSDDELLDYMKEHFDGDCQGSLDYLEETCLENFCRDIRKGNIHFLGCDIDED